MIKNVLQSQCRYYDVTMTLEDLGWVVTTILIIV
jgi:hypothetical protein